MLRPIRVEEGRVFPRGERVAARERAFRPLSALPRRGLCTTQRDPLAGS